MAKWNQGDVKLALDVIDWCQLWGTEPVGFHRWWQRLHTGSSAGTANRAWERFKQRLRQRGYLDVMEQSVDPLSHHNGISVAILSGGRQRAEQFLDDVEEARQARRRSYDRERGAARGRVWRSRQVSVAV